MDFTKYKGKISNSGSDERGKYSGGQAGDQTGTEWAIINWYSRPWTCVLRYPDQAARQMFAELSIEAANNNHIGYDQNQRTTYWTQLQKVGYRPSKITVNCEADCSAGVIANVKATGYLLSIAALKNLSSTYTGNMRSGFKSAGFQVLTDKKYLNSADYLVPGDILLYDGHHTATNLGIGSKSGYKTASNGAAAPSSTGSNETTTSTKTIQNMLNAAGWSVEADNEYGPATTKAVKEFQSLYGLESDGIVGDKTLAVLKAVYSIVQNGFDANYYSSTYPDLKQAFGTDKKKLLNHYYTFGQKEGRSYKKTTSTTTSKYKTGIVTAGLLNVRTEPKITANKLVTYPTLRNGAPVTILDTVNGWYFVEISGETGAKYSTGNKGTRKGYVSASYVKVQ